MRVVVCISLLSILLHLHSVEAATTPYYTALTDGNGVLTQVSGFQFNQQRPVLTGGTTYTIDLSKGTNYLLDFSGVTNLGNPVGVSVFVTGQDATQQSVGIWEIKQNSGNTASLVWTGVSVYALSGASMQPPSTANASSIFVVYIKDAASGGSVYPLSGVTP